MSDQGGVIKEIVTRVRQAVGAERIVLFGSRARGDARTASDFDILIIAPSGEPRWRRAVPVYHALSGLGAPVDVVWWTPEEVAEWSGVRSHFVTTALREGRVVYESAA